MARTAAGKLDVSNETFQLHLFSNQISNSSFSKNLADLHVFFSCNLILYTYFFPFSEVFEQYKCRFLLLSYFSNIFPPINNILFYSSMNCSPLFPLRQILYANFPLLISNFGNLVIFPHFLYSAFCSIGNYLPLSFNFFSICFGNKFLLNPNIYCFLWCWVTF